MNLNRENVDLSVVKADYASSIEEASRLFQSIGSDLTCLPPLVSACTKAARTGLALGVDLAEVLRYFRLAAQANVGIFYSSAVQSADVQIGDKHLIATNAPDESFAHVVRWTYAYFNALFCREFELIDHLHIYPLDSLRKCSTKFAEYAYLFSNAIRAFHEGRLDEVGVLLIDALAKANPKNYPSPDPDSTLFLDFPIIKLFTYVVTNDDRFESGLRDAILDHKEFWTSYRNPSSHVGFVPVQLLGIASLAFSRGLVFNVDSDYLPMRLVRGEVS